jgi:hypothetical protein
MKLNALNRNFITEEMLQRFVNNRWRIHIGKNIGHSILKHDYLEFKTSGFLTSGLKTIPDSSILATNRIINMKYNNIENKDVALNDLLQCYDTIYRTNNPRFSKYIKSEDIKVFKGLLGGSFDLNILAYVNIYNIYEIFTSSTVGKLSVFKEKLKDNYMENFDRRFNTDVLSLLMLSVRSNILFEKTDKKQVSLLCLNKNEMGLKYMGLLNTIFDNCLDVKYYKFRVYIAIQICKFILLFENLEKHPIIDKMRGFVNQLRYRAIPIPEYLYSYATFEMSYILSKV